MQALSILFKRLFELLMRPVRFIAHRTWLFLRSIRFRLTAWFVIILGFVLLAFSSFVYSRQARDLRAVALERLLESTRQVAALYRFAQVFLPPNSQQSLPDLINSEEQFLQKDQVLVLIGSQGQILQKLGPISDADLSKLVTLETNQIASNDTLTLPIVDTSVKGNGSRKEYLFAMATIPLRGNSFDLLVLGSPVDPGGQLRNLALTLLLGSLATLVIALAGGYWLANRAMHPVKIITRAAHEISETDLNRRLNLHSPDELGELADTFDQMLAKLNAAFNRQRQFTADASHELRTPLTIVNLEAERALSSRHSSDEYQQALEVIQSENEFMIRLVNDLMTLARMDAGQAVLQPEVLDLSDVALEVVERLAPLAVRNNIKITTGELPELVINGDRQFLSQMLSNLVENAIKYTRGQEKRVYVETGCRNSGNGAQAWVQVSDNGPGITPEHLQHIFDRFYQVDKARTHGTAEGDSTTTETESPSGSGLGLSIVQWIVQAHGGQVSVKSEAGKGSTFEVSLPMEINYPNEPL